jgi:hypothetical protein
MFELGTFTRNLFVCRGDVEGDVTTLVLPKPTAVSDTGIGDWSAYSAISNRDETPRIHKEN